MRKNIFLKITLLTIVLSLTSCKVTKHYVQHVSKKEEIKNAGTKKVLVFSTDDIKVNQFIKTFDKNYSNAKTFKIAYLKDFREQLNFNNLFFSVNIEEEKTNYATLNTENTDYVIYFSNIEVANRVEVNHTAPMGMNGVGGMSGTSSVEFCVITIKVEVYDAKTEKEILDFVAIGEESVFLFDYTKTFMKAKERSIKHIINYLKSGKTEYEKY